MKIISNKRYNDFMFAYIEYKGLQEYAEIFIQNNKRLKERIDKVKEYIKGGCEGHDYYEYDYILELLEGDK